MAHSSAWTNPKFIKLARILNEPLVHVIGHLDALWNAAYEHALPRGHLERDEVEIDAQWDGEKDAFVSGCILCNILKPLFSGKVKIKNFLVHCPDYIRKRIARNKKGREFCPDTRRTTTGHRPPTQPNPTQPNRTEQPPPPTPSKQEGDEAAGGGGIMIETETAKKKLRERGMRDSKTIAEILSKRTVADIIGWCDWFDAEREAGSKITAGLLAKKLLSDEPPPLTTRTPALRPGQAATPMPYGPAMMHWVCGKCGKRVQGSWAQVVLNGKSLCECGGEFTEAAERGKA